MLTADAGVGPTTASPSSRTLVMPALMKDCMHMGVLLWNSGGGGRIGQPRLEAGGSVDFTTLASGSSASQIWPMVQPANVLAVASELPGPNNHRPGLCVSDPG